MKSVGLFSGIGGIELGLSNSGIKHIQMSEILPEAREVLRCHFPKTEILHDVKLIKSLPSSDLLCAGFPCQDLSSSGPKGGITGERSGLLSHIFRLLKKQRCEWVLLENVKFMLHLNGGHAMDAITNELESLGYRWAYRLMNSQNFGVPHRRERVYILASLSHEPETVLFRAPLKKKAEVKPNYDLKKPIGFYWTEGRYATGLAADAIPPLKGGSTIGIPSAPGILLPSGLAGTPDIRDAERLQGFPLNWTEQAEKVARPSVRWKLVGNAVTVNVCSWIGEGFRRPNSDPIRTRRYEGKKWPHTCMGYKGKKFEIVEPYGPNHSSSLQDFLQFPLKPLSEKAAAGFIKRSYAGNLKYPEGFIEKLENYISTHELAANF